VKGAQAVRSASDARIDAQRLALKKEGYGRPIHRVAALTSSADPLIAEQKKLLEERKRMAVAGVLARQKGDGVKKFTGTSVGSGGIVYTINPKYGSPYREEQTRQGMEAEDRNIGHLRGATGGGGSERIRGLMGHSSSH